MSLYFGYFCIIIFIVLMLNVFFVFLGSGLGGVLRFLVSKYLETNKTFPLATFTSNSIACFILGGFIAYQNSHKDIASSYKFFIVIGICGGFSTFSTFTLDNWCFLVEKNYSMFAINILTNVFLCILLLLIGHKVFSYIS